ncbi:helix-hairpin-helix domain-containing protein [bacterium]|nr:helix-hairpin-helix domain-containing protein [bacterium]MBU3955616.1 helix-hairpin-helix domain-containing protein [bacterium]
MYKKGINLNTVTVETLKTLPGIGDNLARSLALHRELKSEFVNPSEFSAIVPEHVYSGIAKEYNIYAVSPVAWKSRITNEKNKLYNADLQIFFLKDSSIALSAEKNIYIINLPAGGDLRKAGVEDMLHEIGALAGLKKIFGWKPAVKALLLTELPDMEKLNKFLARYDTASLLCIREDELLNMGSKHGDIAAMIMAKKLKVLTAPGKIKSGDFEIKTVYPLTVGESSACSMLLSFGSVSILLMFHMTDSDQLDFIHKPGSSAEIRPNAVYSYGTELLPVFMQFCGSPKLIDIRKENKLKSDGNLIYAERHP